MYLNRFNEAILTNMRKHIIYKEHTNKSIPFLHTIPLHLDSLSTTAILFSWLHSLGTNANVVVVVCVCVCVCVCVLIMKRIREIQRAIRFE